MFIKHVCKINYIQDAKQRNDLKYKSDGYLYFIFKSTNELNNNE